MSFDVKAEVYFCVIAFTSLQHHMNKDSIEYNRDNAMQL